MSLAGTWKKVKVDNGMAFGKAIGATDEQLAAQAQAVSTVTYEVNGNNIKVTRVHKIGDKEIVSLSQPSGYRAVREFQLIQLMIFRKL